MIHQSETPGHLTISLKLVREPHVILRYFRKSLAGHGWFQYIDHVLYP